MSHTNHPGEIQAPSEARTKRTRLGTRGWGVLRAAQQDQALDMLRSGMTQQATADQIGVSKNIIAGIWNRQGDPVAMRDAATLFARCDALHAQMDAVLAETLGVGKIVETPVVKAARR